jgi:hypothetical protein
MMQTTKPSTSYPPVYGGGMSHVTFLMTLTPIVVIGMRYNYQFC